MSKQSQNTNLHSKKDEFYTKLSDSTKQIYYEKHKGIFPIWKDIFNLIKLKQTKEEKQLKKVKEIG